MNHLWEILLGLEHGFFSREGEFSLQFSPRWPLQEVLGAGLWNLALGVAALALVAHVYRRETRSRSARIILAIMRLALFGFVIALLNRPTFSIAQSRTESSILAIMMDDSLSMTVRDTGPGVDGQGQSRFAAMLDLVGGENRRLLRDLSQKHVVKLYTFDSDVHNVGTVALAAAAKPESDAGDIAPSLDTLKPMGKSTQVLACLRHVLEDLQGQRLAGVVLLTDGRDAPAESVAEAVAAVRGFGVRIYPVAIGAEQAPRNVVVEDLDMEAAAFVQDNVSAKVRLRITGYPAGHQVTVVLKDKATGMPLVRADGKPAQAVVTVDGTGQQVAEVVFKPSKVQTLDVVAEAIKQPGQIGGDDNVLTRQIDILDSRIAVLYCDGYPRWDYRYLKTALIRDATVDISCLLLSADPGFAQEGKPASKTFPGPITRFPQTMSELLAYDVVLFGDVDPRQLTDAQLQLVSDFVLKRNGGFGMIAGPRWAPMAYRNTPIEALLPVSIARAPAAESPEAALTAGWRIVLTREGMASSIFRFFEDPAKSQDFIEHKMEPLFWYCRGVVAKPNVSQVLAEHPTETGPDGRKAPILVLGRFGGRTLFSAIDDSWRWRFYTGESIFDTYWVQQIRYLARERKLGQRRLTLAPLRPAYELGQVVEVHLRVLDPELLGQLSDRINLSVTTQTADGAEQLVGQQTLRRRENDPELYVASWTADQVGQFVLKMPALAANTQALQVPVAVKAPSLELMQPQVDRDLLAKLSQNDSADVKAGAEPVRLVLDGQSSLPTLRQELARIPSAGLTQLVYTNHLLWNAPLAMVLFLGLITAEWIVRKVYGML